MEIITQAFEYRGWDCHVVLDERGYWGVATCGDIIMRYTDAEYAEGNSFEQATENLKHHVDSLLENMDEEERADFEKAIREGVSRKDELHAYK